MLKAILKRNEDILEFAIEVARQTGSRDTSEVKDAVYRHFGRGLVRKSFEVHCVVLEAIERADEPRQVRVL